MLILVTGDRKWDDVETMASALDFLNSTDTVVEGEADGADVMARELALIKGANVKKYPARWKLFGRAAGPIRNKEMLKEDPEVVYAFHKNIRKSKGTKDMITQSLKKGIPVSLHVSLTESHSFLKLDDFLEYVK